MKTEKGELIFMCRGADGKFSRQIKVAGLQDEIQKLQGEMQREIVDFEDRLYKLDKKINISIFAELYFLFAGINHDDLKNVTDTEKNIMIPLAEKLVSALLAWKEDLSSDLYQNSMGHTILKDCKLHLLFLIYIYKVLIEKNKIINILASRQIEILDNIILKNMNCFNNHVDDKWQQNSLMIDSAQNLGQCLSCIIFDLFINLIKTNTKEDLKFRIENIPEQKILLTK